MLLQVCLYLYPIVSKLSLNGRYLVYYQHAHLFFYRRVLQINFIL